MEEDRRTVVPKVNPDIDPTAVDRSRDAAQRLADVGIKLGGYHLEPALGGKIIKSADQAGRSSPGN